MTRSVTDNQAANQIAPIPEQADVPVPILVVDDDQAIVDLAKSLLEAEMGAVIDTAASADEAIEKVRGNNPPLLVLTDLNMPGTSGLELVDEIRKLHPDLPAVVMTAHGSEEIAVEALRRGAASYVAKKMFNRDLVEIIREVLSVRSEQYSFQRTHDCLQSASYVYTLPNDRTIVRPLVVLLQKRLRRFQHLGPDEIMRVGIALTEALVNAMVHGNLEVSSSLIGQTSHAFNALIKERQQQDPYKSRCVHVEIVENRKESRYTIRDEGPGFNPGDVPDPTSPDNLDRGFGRGLLLIRTFMDEVTHNECGNEITLIKRGVPAE